MSYLDRLRAIESAKTPEGEPTKPTKAPSVGFVGSPPAHFQNIQGVDSTNDAAIDPAAEARRQRVIAMLAENPNVRRAVVVDDPDTDPVLVAVGIRDVATFELVIPAARFDAFKLLELIERYGATLH